MKAFLGVAGVLALFGICFACLSIYAKKEINKPKFELPELMEVQPLSELPATKEAAYDYTYSLFDGCMKADDIELSRHTDVHLTEGEIVTPFAERDNNTLSRILEKSQGELNGFYPADENVPMTKVDNKPTLDFTKADVTAFTAEKGYTDEFGETVDDGYYYVTLEINPSCINKETMLGSEVRNSIEKKLSPMLSVASLDITQSAYTASFKIDYKSNSLINVEIKRSVTVKAQVDFSEAYDSVSKDTVQLEIPFETVQIIDLFHYGLNFTERQIAVQKNDMKALPLDVRVNSETTKDEYSISFDVSSDGILDIDEDGVMTVIGTREEPVSVTAILEYDGHTYKDSLTVYATEMEVKTDEPQNN